MYIKVQFQAADDKTDSNFEIKSTDLKIKKLNNNFQVYGRFTIQKDEQAQYTSRKAKYMSKGY